MKLKWVELAQPVSRVRYDLLSETLTAMKVENEVHYVECSADDFEAEYTKAKSTYDQILIGAPFTELCFNPAMDLTATVQFVKAVDAVFKDSTGKWWPQSVLFEAFIYSLAHRLKALDFNASVLMVGAGGAARAILSALARVGFTKFNITDRHQEKALTLISDLKRTFFNIKFEYVPQSGITALPGMHSLVINTTPLIESNDLIRELQFYNFLKEGGAVIDLTLTPPKTPLLEEAEHIGAKIVQGFEVAAEIDAVWAKLVTGQKLDVDAYSAKLKERLTAVPFNLEPFRQQ